MKWIYKKIKKYKKMILIIILKENLLVLMIIKNKVNKILIIYKI
jgi:hypothetical protein